MPVKPKKVRGSRRLVWHGNAEKTVGGLKKREIMLNKGNLVSVDRHHNGKKHFGNVSHWTNLVRAIYRQNHFQVVHDPEINCPRLYDLQDAMCDAMEKVDSALKSSSGSGSLLERKREIWKQLYDKQPAEAKRELSKSEADEVKERRRAIRSKLMKENPNQPCIRRRKTKTDKKKKSKDTDGCKFKASILFDGSDGAGVKETKAKKAAKREE
eukprot:jgi/Mesvir1/26536/Mv16191-RA.1